MRAFNSYQCKVIEKSSLFLWDEEKVYAGTDLSTIIGAVVKVSLCLYQTMFVLFTINSYLNAQYSAKLNLFQGLLEFCKFCLRN